MHRLSRSVALFMALTACGHAAEGPRATETPAAEEPAALQASTRAAEPSTQTSAEVPVITEADTFIDPSHAPSDVAAAPANATRTASGLASRVLRPGVGTRHPSASSSVEVHYSGWTTDGRLFDSSVQRGQSISFPLNRVIAGWTEGVQLMVEGERRRFWIPAAMAYGENPRPGAPAGMLVFDVELIHIND